MSRQTTTEGTPTSEEALEYAANAIKNGDSHVARKVLVWILKKDPQNVPAWLLIGDITEDREEKIKCYSQVLEIDPENETAKEALDKYGAAKIPRKPADIEMPEAVVSEGKELLKENGSPPAKQLEIIAPVEESEDKVRAELDVARHKLLDMGLRNKLLNYRPLKSKGLEIDDEKPIEVYRILVEEGRSMSFLPVPEKEDSDDESQLVLGEADGALAQPEETDEKDPGRHTDDKLQTPYTSPILQRRLLNSYYAARTYFEEQGVNILFLALGMLHWYESEHSSEKRKAPLVLVPVELSRSSVKGKFRIRYSEDEIVENLSLRFKLAGDFGISMPEFPEEDLVLASYFGQVVNAIEAEERWEVNEDALAIGFFSYGKFLMFNDLKPEIWPEDLQPDQHPILRGLLQDGFDDGLDYIDDNVQIDEIISLEEIHQVVDADSSQVLAIHDVNRGRNLVIQGPPGTGKSQTITNLIAEAIGHNKTVLFVSEKMAALEVVKRRLDQVGLGDACLELHGRNTRKKAVLDELERSLKLGQPKREGKADIAELKRNQERLNGYSRAVNEEIGKSGLTPYEVYGRLIQLRKVLAGKDLPELEIEDIDHLSGSDFQKALALTEEMQLFLGKMGRPIDHPFWGSNISVLLPADKDQIKQCLSDAVRSVSALQDAAGQFSEYLLLPAARLPSEASDQVTYAEKFLAKPDLSGVSVKAESWTAGAAELREVFEAGLRIRSIRRRYEAHLKEDAWGADVAELRDTIHHYGSKFWRVVSPGYRDAKRQLARLVSGEPPKSIDGQLKLLDAILERRGLLPIVQGYQEEGHKLFGDRWRGIDSDWDELIEISRWLSATHEQVNAGELGVTALDFLATNPDTKSLENQIAAVTTSVQDHEASIKSLISTLKLDEAVRFGKGQSLVDREFSKQEFVLTAWERELDRLHEIVVLRGLAPQLIAAGLNALIKVSLTWHEARHILADLLQKVWLTALLQRAMIEREALRTFDGEMHENAMRRFCELDVKLLNQNRIRLAHEHWKTIPKHQAAGQLGTLRLEFARRRGHMPIRKLMHETGKVIQVIKPVFMMSPLSIAQFLPPGTMKFDLVVFDEASQVKPVDAFGAILRGNQLVVVGDDRQLPPTTFFETSIDVDEDYSDSVTMDVESILGLSVAQGTPHRMLRWHYRSQHESLIAVSNHEFYDHMLVIFPSPDKDRQQFGLAYHYLPETEYDRGGSRKNIEEAREVASAVMRHAEESPDLTLGVATFSSSQQEAVRDAIEFARRQDSSLEEFFGAHPEEPFFVKNLENVQGDERDVIFISIGYGRAADGRVAMNFGPVNQDGGERRLNVLITRARKRCEVFTNLKADDIDLDRTRSRGVHVLKRFLKYAESGELDLPIVSGREADSPFELSVASELRKLGHRVEHQIGTSGFFIDLAVVDPDMPGRYLLGIECDGAMYHSARSARDRDRIRQEVLERLGWQIHRIWSTDWFHNPQRELGRVGESIAYAKQNSLQNDAEVVKSNSSGKAQITEIKRHKITSRDQPAIKVSAYKIAGVNNTAYKDRLHEVAPRTMADWIAQIVNIESPVHEDDVARRIVNSAGIKRLGRRIQAAFDSGRSAAVRNKSVMKRGNFLWKPDMSQPKLRLRSDLPAASRKLELIAPEEIELAIIEVVKTSYGIPREDIPSEVCALFGFQRMTKSMRSLINKIAWRMLRENKIVERGENIELPE